MELTIFSIAGGLLLLFGWVKVDLGTLRKSVSDLEKTIENWRMFMDALVGELAKDTVHRLLSRPRQNPDPKSIVLPEEVTEDIRQVVAGRKEEDIADLVGYLVESHWGLEKVAEFIREENVSVEDFLRGVIFYVVKIREANSA